MNTLLPFSFENLPIRGRLIRLEELDAHVPTLKEATEPMQQMLAELLTFASLLEHDTKHTMDVSLQLQHPGHNALVFAQCKAQTADKPAIIRAYANEAAQHLSFETLSKPHKGQGGRFAFTLQPAAANMQPYQSLVPLHHTTVAECLRLYFAMSAQTPTLLKSLSGITPTGGVCTGAIMLQGLPGKPLPEDDFNRLQMILNTIEPAEILPGHLSGEQLLARLFAEDEIRVYQTETFAFGADNPRERMLTALASLPAAEIKQLLAEGPLEMTDQVSGQRVTFTEADLKHLLTQGNA